MIKVVGLGPGHSDYIIPMATQAISEASVIIGYHYYFQFIQHLVRPDALCIGKELSEEEKRAEIAIQHALEGEQVVVIGSGDASIYAMASIVYQKVAEQKLDIPVETVPGISAFVTAGSKLGAILGHDFCCISLSDLMTPWTTIEKRIHAAAMGDFVTGLYNPKSKKRYWQLGALKTIYLKYRPKTTPVAICKQLGRTEEEIKITTLAELDVDEVDMFCVVLIGNSQTFRYKDHLITPRGYLNRKPETGEEIQQASFKEILDNIPSNTLANDTLWAAIRCIHTSGDFEYINYLETSKHAIATWHDYLKNGGTIVTDVTMVAAGITKAYTAKYGNQVVCLLNDKESLQLAEKEGLTRTQAGIKLAAKKYPNALFVIGNAPTALIEIADQIQEGILSPTGVIGAPVGFINVIESKERLKTISHIPYALITKKRGGSNFAAAIVNAAFTLEEAKL
ncbi:precorrin-3B C17-methyltransferase [Aquimarina sp. EL_43]|uniref:precorrin-3B C(17)-methyltransferase n=1 Tax=unclassified Aquimarina TaxID=2627091 RepID=UPI0018CB94F0|nr:MULTISPECIES: precorrin-3B C(17)-methyltransferase [unclassified Aquimarina]MBG6130285.1 precorrin-3B C17-methyltransferase [Aquimarina sp. EL_35]MBG6149065.1 precorrin-3B C17-methyltransferase [Aquimarina sp. EL_32]MBG6168561.1 precorrin-3B C17-methyltransferase [Aquimarina sp. EL_43]